MLVQLYFSIYLLCGIVRDSPCQVRPVVGVGEVSISLQQYQVRPDRGKSLQVCAFLCGGGFPPSIVKNICYYTLIQCNVAACHHSMVSVPGGGGVCHPVIQIGNNNSKLLQSASKAKDPIYQLDCLSSQRPSGACMTSSFEKSRGPVSGTSL